MTNLELVRKAARGRDIRLIGCFASNRSAAKMEQVGEPILRDIERFLEKEFSSDDGSFEDIQKQWLGIANVLHVYFKVAASSAEVDSAAFLLSLFGWLREEATRVVFVLWGPAMGLQSGPIPDRVRWAIGKLALAGTERERDLAKRLLKFQSTLARKRLRTPALAK